MRIDGEVTGVGAVVIDVTDLKAAEMRLEGVLRQLPVGVVIADAAGRVLLTNQRLGEMGMSVAPSGTYLAEAEFAAWHGDGRPYAREEWPLARSLTRGEVVRGEEMEFAGSDGSRRVLEANSAPIRDGMGTIVAAVVVVQDVTARRQATHRQDLLVRAGEVLDSALGVDERLDRFARLLVPQLADFVKIELLEGKSGRRPVAIAHQDPAREALMRAWRDRGTLAAYERVGMGTTMATGEAKLTSEIVPEAVVQSALESTGAEGAELMRAIGPRSQIVVPLRARGRVLGALSLTMAESGRHYDEADLDLARDLGLRAGLAVDNARLYEEAQASAVAEQRRAEMLDALAAASLAIHRTRRRRPAPAAHRRPARAVDRERRGRKRVELRGAPLLGDRRRLRLLVQPCVVDGEPGTQPEVAREVEIGLAVVTAGLGHRQRERAEHTPAGAQRHHDLRARPDRLHQVRALLPGALARGLHDGVGKDVGGQLRLAGRERGPHADPLLLPQRAALAPSAHQRLACGVLVGDRDRPAAALALQQLDLHVVREPRDEQSREPVEPLVDAERRVEHLAGVHEQVLALGGEAALGDVLHHHHGGDDRAVGVADRRRVGLDRALLTVRPDVRDLLPAHDLALAQRPDDRELLERVQPAVGPRALEAALAERGAEPRLRAQPHLLELAVAERHVAVGVDDRHADRELLEHALETQLGSLAVGDVDHHGADAGDLAVLAHREPAREHVAQAAGAGHLARQLAFEHRFAGREHLPVDRHQLLRELGKRLVDPAAEVVLDRAAVDLREGRVDAHETQLAVDEGQTDGGTLADHVEQCAGLAP